MPGPISDLAESFQANKLPLQSSRDWNRDMKATDLTAWCRYPITYRHWICFSQRTQRHRPLANNGKVVFWAQSTSDEAIIEELQKSPSKQKTQNCKMPQSELDYTDNRGTTSLKKLKSSTNTPDMPSRRDRALTIDMAILDPHTHRIILPFFGARRLCYRKGVS